MIDFKLALILGSDLQEIKQGIDSFESMHLGLFINSLRYKTEKEGVKLKQDFIRSTDESIKIINKNITNFNQIISYINKSGIKLLKLEELNRTAIKKVILEHQGHHPQETKLIGIYREQVGLANSPSALARKHTALRISNIILRTKISLSEFVKSTDRFLEIFESIQSDKFRKTTRIEIEKARASYSIGLFGESIFILGRLLENLIGEYMLLLKKNGRITLKIGAIKKLEFHNKIEFLYNRKLSILSDSQYSKLMSIKWDRNIYGHRINVEVKDHKAIIEIALRLIECLEDKTANHKSRSRPVV